MISRRPSPRATTPALIRRESTRHLVAESSCFGKVNITRLKSFVGVSGAQRWANGMVCFSLAASHFPVCTPVGSMTTGVTRFLCNSEAFSNPGETLLAPPPFPRLLWERCVVALIIHSLGSVKPLCCMRSHPYLCPLHLSQCRSCFYLILPFPRVASRPQVTPKLVP